MEKSASIQNLAKALCSFQSSVGKVKKDSANPFFKSKYASLSNILDAIQDPLASAGLSFSQFPTGESGLTTILMHSESGEFLMETYIMRPVKVDPQGIGSAITYQRRYALGAVLGLNIDDDDDANAASDQSKQQKADSKAKPTKKVDIMDGLMDAIEGAVTMDELVEIWEGNKSLHKNDTFLKAMNEARAKFIVPISTQQKTQILLLLDHSTITQNERDAMKEKLSSIDTTRAEEAIVKLKKTIAERSTSNTPA
jgi:hypothetical protein